MGGVRELETEGEAPLRGLIRVGGEVEEPLGEAVAREPPPEDRERGRRRSCADLRASRLDEPPRLPDVDARDVCETEEVEPALAIEVRGEASPPCGPEPRDEVLDGDAAHLGDVSEVPARDEGAREILLARRHVKGEHDELL